MKDLSAVSGTFFVLPTIREPAGAEPLAGTLGTRVVNQNIQHALEVNNHGGTCMEDLLSHKVTGGHTLLAM